VEHSAVVLTLNGDFADVRQFPIGTLPGVVRLRVFPTTVPVLLAALERLLNSVPEASLKGALTIVSRTRIRQTR
jgi:hypothetical protein